MFEASNSVRAVAFCDETRKECVTMAQRGTSPGGANGSPFKRERVVLLLAVLIAATILVTFIQTALAASTDGRLAEADPACCPPPPPYGGHGFYYIYGYGAPPTGNYPGYYTGYNVPYYPYPQGYSWPAPPYYGAYW